MVAERDGLRRLQVREPRHHRCRMFESFFGERALVCGQRCVNFVDRVADPEPEIGRNLIVARARGMQPPRRRADQFAEPALDVHMNIFERTLELELAGFDL